MVSHEFRTPLGIIQSSAEILEDYLEQLKPAERDEHLRSIRKSTRRMADLMEEVLLLGSFDAGRMEFKPGLLNLRSFVTRIIDEVRSPPIAGARLICSSAKPRQTFRLMSGCFSTSSRTF